MRRAILFGLFAFLAEFSVGCTQCSRLQKLTKIKDVTLARRHPSYGTSITNAKSNGTRADNHKNGKGKGNGNGGKTHSASAVSAASVANIGSIATIAIAPSIASVASSASAVSAANVASAATRYILQAETF